MCSVVFQKKPRGDKKVEKGSKKRSAELRRQAEEKIKSSITQIKDISCADKQKLIHELETYQIELEIQNEELRLIHEQLKKSREKYVDLYDFAPVGYVILNEKGIIIEANLTAASMLGVERGKLIDTTIYRYSEK